MYQKEFIIEISGNNAVEEAKSLTKAIKEKNISGIFVEQKKAVPKEGELSIGEWMPIIMGASTIAASITGLFLVIKTRMDRITNRETLASNERIAEKENESKKTKVVITTTDDEGNPFKIDFSNYTDQQIERFLKFINPNV